MAPRCFLRFFTRPSSHVTAEIQDERCQQLLRRGDPRTLSEGARCPLARCCEQGRRGTSSWREGEHRPVTRTIGCPRACQRPRKTRAQALRPHGSAGRGRAVKLSRASRVMNAPDQPSPDTAVKRGRRQPANASAINGSAARSQRGCTVERSAHGFESVQDASRAEASKVWQDRALLPSSLSRGGEDLGAEGAKKRRNRRGKRDHQPPHFTTRGGPTASRTLWQGHARDGAAR